MLRPQQATVPGDGIPDSPEAGLLALSRISAQLAGEFLALQTRAAKLMLADTMQPREQLGRRLFPSGGESLRAQEMQAIAWRWAELIWLTQSAFIRAFFSVPYARPAPDFVPERRVSARIIRFPERRAGKR